VLIDLVLCLCHAKVAGSTPARSISDGDAILITGLARPSGLANPENRVSSVVEHQAFNLVAAGSTPALGTSALLALVVEQPPCISKCLSIFANMLAVGPGFDSQRGHIFFDGLIVYQKNCCAIYSIMKELYLASAVITLTSFVEAFGLYFIRSGEIMNASLIYGLCVVPLLSWAVKYEGIGLVNFMWNIFSTLFGFGIGIYLYKEKMSNMKIMGVLVSLLGVGMILLDPDAK
jgi:multidrug transporter EmrE-like cation transporter